MTLPLPVVVPPLGPEAGVGQSPGLLVTQSGDKPGVAGQSHRIPSGSIWFLPCGLCKEGFPSYQGLSHIMEEMWPGS